MRHILNNITLPETNISLKIGHPKRKFHLPTINFHGLSAICFLFFTDTPYFQGRTRCYFQGGYSDLRLIGLPGVSNGFDGRRLLGLKSDRKRRLDTVGNGSMFLTFRKRLTETLPFKHSLTQLTFVKNFH